MTARNYQQKLDLSRFGGGADSDEDDAPTPKIVLAAEKQNTFAYGIQRKSKKDREREEEKRKKEEEERDAARVFAEFTAEFEGEGSAGSSRKSRGGFVREGGSGGPAYEPPRAPAAYGRAPGAFGRAPVKPRSPSPPPASKPKGKRVINSFLEDLKRDQAAREDRFKRSGRAGGSVSAHAAWENPKDRGSHDLGDANTTNLFVGNLPQAVTDQSLGLLFAKLGPIGSVKVMYPRFEESSVDPMSRRVGARAGLSGFVAYMKRSDAERAVHDMDGLDWGGNILKVGWSKSVPIPARPIYDITSSSSRARSRSRSPLRHAKRQRSVSPLKREKNYSGRGSSYDQRPRSHSRSRSRSRSPSHSRNSPNLKPETEKLLKTVAAKVRDLGKPFEDMLREKERDNEKFNFLRDSTLPEYHFFRSLLNPRHRMPTPPPPPPPDFVDEGYNSIYSTDSEEDSERERTRKGKLGKLARRRFVSCLRGLKGERGDIARCMAFALDHADSADEISDLIIQSLSIFETPVPLKVARLHLISDILSNSASPVPNAWKYRGAFEARLPAVFDHFGVLYSSFKAQMGRLSAEQFKSQITNVLDVLEIWIVFNPAYTDDLRVRLSGAQVTSTGGASGDGTPPSTKASSEPSAAGPAPSKFKKGGFSSSFVSDAAEQKEEEDLDGAPMGEDLDGAPLDDSLDGEPMGAEEEDLDGEAMEDVDGEPM